MHKTITLRTTMLAGAAALTLAATGAQAAEVRFNIPPQDLSAALREFGMQSGQPIMFSGSAISGAKSPGVRGAYEPADALGQLLGGVRATYSRAGAGFVVTPQPAPARIIKTAMVSAAPEAAPPAAAASAPVGLEEIIVTAQRRSEALQSVPIAVSAFTSETLERSGVTDTLSVQQLVPGLVLNKSYAAAVPWLRGVGSISSGLGAEMSVATYLDGFYIPNPASGIFALNNVERVEVLRGPQGTLFGRNASGGVIQVVTRTPDAAPSLDASISYDNYDTLGLNLYGTTAVTDDLAVSLAVSHSDQGEGWGRNLYTGKDAFLSKQTGVQGKARWSPTDDTEITLSAFYNDLDSDLGANLGIFPGQFGTDGTPYLGRYTVRHVDTYTKSKQGMLGLKIEHDFGWASLVSMTAYHKLDTKFFFAQNGILGRPVAGQGATNIDVNGETRTWTQEVQLLSNDDAPFQWILGAFYLDDETYAAQGIFGTCVGAVCAPTPNPLLTLQYQDTSALAAFGQATFDLPASSRLTVGLRYTEDTKSLDGLIVPYPGQPNSLAAVPAGTVVRPGQAFAGFPGGIDTKSTWPKLTWRLALDHDFTDNIMGYVSYNRGFKSGVYNIAGFTNPPSRPEVLDAYEIGLKNTLFDNRLRLNVAAFYYDFTDIQLRTSAPPAPAGQTILFNAAKAEIKGADVEFEWAATANLTVTGGLELLDAKYTEFPGGSCIAPRPITGTVLGGTVTTVCDRAGARMIRAPEVSGLLGFTYTQPTSVGEVQLAVKDTYSGEFFWDPSNRLKQDAYHYVNASLTLTAPSERWDVQLFGRNLLDETYFTNAFEGGGGMDTYSPGDPRTYGVKVGVHF